MYRIFLFFVSSEILTNHVCIHNLVLRSLFPLEILIIMPPALLGSMRYESVVFYFFALSFVLIQVDQLKSLFP